MATTYHYIDDQPPIPRTVDLTSDENRATLEAGLRQLLTDAAAATATLQAIRDTAQPTVTTFPQAQTVIRALQVQVKDQARLQQEHIKRTVALARIVAGVLDSTDNT